MHYGADTAPQCLLNAASCCGRADVRQLSTYDVRDIIAAAAAEPRQSANRLMHTHGARQQDTTSGAEIQEADTITMVTMAAAGKALHSR